MKKSADLVVGTSRSTVSHLVDLTLTPGSAADVDVLPGLTVHILCREIHTNDEFSVDERALIETVQQHGIPIPALTHFLQALACSSTSHANDERRMDEESRD